MDGYLLDLAHPDSFQKWTLVCAGVLTIIYVVMRPFKKKRKDPLTRPSSTSLAGQRDMEKQMTELLVELEQMSRQMTAQLQTRATKLELLIKEADEKIATLRRLAGATPAQVRMDIAPGMKTTEDSRHAEVYDLADQGRSPRQISQQLHRPYGEVELILALRGHQQAEAS